MADIEKEFRHYLEGDVEPRAALEWSRETSAAMVDLKFCDLLGTWQHVTLPVGALDESAFDEGLGFDGSSIRGWQGIEESDMLLMPDASSAILDPFTEVPTLSLLCEIAEPVTLEPYAKDPRRVAKRAEDYLRASGIADTCFIGPECEFFVFDEVSYTSGPNEARYKVDSAEGHWNSGAPGLGYTIREKQGYFPPAPHDTLSDLRTRMVLTLERIGIPCEFHHHEVGSAGQCEIDLRFQSLTRMADQVLLYKYVVKNTALAAGKSATFMPKPIFGDNGSGMHCHQSLWKEGTPLFADKSGPAGLSQLARSYVAGLLDHAPALLALCAPTSAGLRGAGQSRVLVAQPQCVHPHPDVQRVAEGEADRVPLPRPDGESVSRVRGDADGRPRRHRARARSRRAVRLRPLRGRSRRHAGARLANRVARRARGGPRVPHEGRRVQQGPDQHLDRLEARARGRCSAAAAASAGVRPLLRLLSRTR